MKRWLLSHSQHLNFSTILVLASVCVCHILLFLDYFLNLFCKLEYWDVLSQVPNPLFDLAGIMCGQFGIPFWKFFLATFIGKAIIKTHIQVLSWVEVNFIYHLQSFSISLVDCVLFLQTLLIISVCNNQLLNYVENLIMLLGFIPGVSSFLPSIISRVNAVRDKYLTAPTPIVTSNIKVVN